MGGLLKLLGLHGGSVESEGLWNHWVEMFQKQLYKQSCGQERGVNRTDGLGNQQRVVVLEVLGEITQTACGGG